MKLLFGLLLTSLLATVCLAEAALEFSGPGAAKQDTQPEQRRLELRKRADATRATAREMRFRRIPWVTDLFEGFRIARLERRPIFLYLITGDPLEDC